ncbi:MAG: serine/threonine-protein kinase PknK, partial [Desulfobacterales bacterium]|nr:serine/threonine-protein kinase PknK [Desulfobacterales bacterium]
MIVIPGYTNLSKIYDSSRSIIYRARVESDNAPVILKILKEDFPAPEEVLRYKHEYEITRKLTHVSGVIRVYSLKKHLNTLMVAMEDFEAESLKKLNDSGKITTGAPGGRLFLEMAIRIVEILGDIHQENIIHKDICPSNIVMNPGSGQIKIIDFGISTALSRENFAVENPERLEGTLAYISPEQTGRMNRTLDYRTDFYSLGVTFYELLTGRLPFETNDPMELVHCHIARRPSSPHERVDEIPKPVSDIVMKLMSKNAEERYHGAWGIKADLKQCLDGLILYKNISPFTLGARDVPVRFQIPQKLHGRERYIETLMDAFDRVSRGKTETMLVTGDSGIGKTVLVREMYKPVTRRRGYFISGGFDEVHVRPYSGLIQAFQELVGQLLTEGEERLGKWRENLMASLGPNGGLIIDVIPELVLIIGEQPPPPKLPMEEGRNRFNLVFRNFISVFARREHPLVIFLDDLQWTDNSTLGLLELLCADQGERLLIIGAYRDSEVPFAHPLRLSLDELREAGVAVHQMALTPLELRHIIRMLSDALKIEPEKTTPLAELVLEKTNGNPFFINEFLNSLYVEKLLEFDFKEGGWRWDPERIQARDITDNVGRLMANRLDKLKEKTRKVLSLAACLGVRFDLETLAIVYERSRKETAGRLREAVDKGLLLENRSMNPDAAPMDAMDVEIQSPDFQLQVSSFQYKFSHHRIRQAAYSLISDSEKQAAHLRVGRLLLRNIPPERRDLKIFDIVNHLNLGRERMASRAEEEELAVLNLIAGKRARASAANDPAHRHFQTGISLLGEDSWEKQYDLSLSLHVGAIETACMIGEFKEMDLLARAVMQHAANLLDRMRVYEARILAYSGRNMPLDAVRVALKALALLGLKLPEKPGKAAILRQLVKVRMAMTFRHVEDIVDLPEMTDPRELAAMHLIVAAISAIYLCNPELFLVVISVGVTRFLKKGNAPFSPLFYSGYGLILCGVMGYVDVGFRFGLISLELLKRLNANEQKCRVVFTFNFFIRPWKEHLRDSLKPMLEAHRMGVETGDLVFSGHSVSMYCLYAFHVGGRLSRLDRELASYSEAIRRLGQERAVNLCDQYRQVISNLRGRSEDPRRLIGACYDERTMLGVHEKANDGSSVF